MSMSIWKSPCAVMPICICGVLVVSGLSQLRAVCQDEGVSESHEQWVSKALRLISDLQELAHDTPEVVKEDPNDPARGLAALAEHGETWLAAAKRADELIWELWLITGFPPQRAKADESLRADLETTVLMYRDYVQRHMHLTEAELNRMALSNAVKAIGSPLWYTTVEFLEAKIGRKMRVGFVLCVCPSSRVVWYPLPEESYEQISRALQNWIAANEKTMDWDLQAGRFRPRSAEYVGTPDLSRVLERVFRSDMETNGRRAR